MDNSKQEIAPAARVGFAVVQRTAYDFLPKEGPYQEWYSEFVAALAGDAAKISPSDQV